MLRDKMVEVLRGENLVYQPGNSDRARHLWVMRGDAYDSAEDRVNLGDEAPGNAYEWLPNEIFINVGIESDAIDWDAMREETVDRWEEEGRIEGYETFPWGWQDDDEDTDCKEQLHEWLASDDGERLKDEVDRDIELTASSVHADENLDRWVAAIEERFERLKGESDD